MDDPGHTLPGPGSGECAVGKLTFGTSSLSELVYSRNQRSGKSHGAVSTSLRVIYHHLQGCPQLQGYHHLLELPQFVCFTNELIRRWQTKYILPTKYGNYFWPVLFYQSLNYVPTPVTSDIMPMQKKLWAGTQHQHNSAKLQKWKCQILGWMGWLILDGGCSAEW